MDKRHTSRIKLVQELYSRHFFSESRPPLSARGKDIDQNSAQINSLIASAAPKFPVSKIALVDLSILQLAIYELVIEKKTPPKVIINEAVDLAHELGGERSPQFINAVLGSIYNPKTTKHDTLD